MVFNEIIFLLPSPTFHDARQQYSLTHSHTHFFLLTHLNSCSPQHQEAPMDPVNEHLKSIVYENHTLKVIDQLKLPTVLEYIHIHTVQDAFDVIR